MWGQIFLGLMAALIVPTLVLAWKTFRVVVVFREYPPHRHTRDEIQYPVGMEPGRTEKLGQRASVSP
jgi:hypothetical protein